MDCLKYQCALCEEATHYLRLLCPRHYQQAKAEGWFNEPWFTRLLKDVHAERNRAWRRDDILDLATFSEFEPWELDAASRLEERVVLPSVGKATPRPIRSTKPVVWTGAPSFCLVCPWSEDGLAGKLECCHPDVLPNRVEIGAIDDLVLNETPPHCPVPPASRTSLILPMSVKGPKKEKALPCELRPGEGYGRLKCVRCEKANVCAEAFSYAQWNRHPRAARDEV